MSVDAWELHVYTGVFQVPVKVASDVRNVLQVLVTVEQ